MKTQQILQSLTLAAVLATSPAAFAFGWDDETGRPGFPGGNSAPGFVNHPIFQESLRLLNEVDDRQERQMDRIMGGLYDKRIHPQEFRRLMDEQREIRKLERQLLADGFLSRFEFRRLDAALDAAGRNIFRAGLDSDGRPGYGGWNSSHPGGGYGGWNR